MQVCDRERERERAGTPTQGTIPGPGYQDLSQRQSLKGLSHPDGLQDSILKFSYFTVKIISLAKKYGKMVKETA